MPYNLTMTNQSLGDRSLMNYTIALLPGDGIGPEVLGGAVAVLDRVGERFGHSFDIKAHRIGGNAIDALGTPLPDETLAACAESDAVMLGAVGGPKWDDLNATVRPEDGLLGLRKSLGLFANVRPVKVHSALTGSSPVRADLLEGVDMVVLREADGRPVLRASQEEVEYVQGQTRCRHAEVHRGRGEPDCDGGV